MKCRVVVAEPEGPSDLDTVCVEKLIDHEFADAIRGDPAPTLRYHREVGVSHFRLEKSWLTNDMGHSCTASGHVGGDPGADCGYEGGGSWFRHVDI